MLARYVLPEMAALWTDQARYAAWARVEVLACEAQVALGVLPAEALADIRRAPVPDPARVAELEADRDHEVLAFLAAYCETMPPESARWVHLGMTSYDVTDTAQGHLLARSVDLIAAAAGDLRSALVGRAMEEWETVCIGRTHGVHAEPTTFGHKLAVFAFAVDRSLRRLEAAREAVAVGTVSGAVGTYALVDPAVEAHVCAELGLGVESAPTQVVARDRHAQLLQALALLGACVEQLALELRLLQRTEVAEVSEAHPGAYQGSSAMPHKRNPSTSERLCGLARLLRGYAGAALEDVALWHERDLSNQAVERVALPDALAVSHYQVLTAVTLVRGLTVHRERMRAEIDRTHGLVYSSLVLADQLAAGGEREHTYRTVQAAAARTATTGKPFTHVLAEQGIATGELRPEAFLTHHQVVRERLERLERLDAEPR
ncbi:adenylosuccinate lyase [Streptacidiphilus sp. MAP12-33]|uniref:adenylosuccinate lyase n=1 Tax=Streptacidiphilus sp. MAP12-33 TaxID=3156266 RepID=UPI003513D2B7